MGKAVEKTTIQDGEFICGKTKEPHFHIYYGGRRSAHFQGHFKIGNTEYEIGKPEPTRDQCCRARHAIGFETKPGIGNWGNSGRDLCYKCLWEYWKDVCKKYKRVKC